MAIYFLFVLSLPIHPSIPYHLEVAQQVSSDPQLPKKKKELLSSQADHYSVVRTVLCVHGGQWVLGHTKLRFNPYF